MFDILSKILNVKELRTKILITLGLLVVFRLGTYIPVPGVNVGVMKTYFAGSTGVGGSLLGMADMFTGGALSQWSIFSLGIMPYITASIIFQLLVAIVPALSRIAHEPNGRKKINQYVRSCTAPLTFVQAIMLIYGLSGLSGGETPFIQSDVGHYEFIFYATISITAGTMFLMWLGEQIDEFGIGNGISILIMSGILSRIPAALHKLLAGTGVDAGASVSLGMITILMALFVAMTLAVVMITLGTRRINIVQKKSTRGGKVYGGNRNYLPLKVNQANVIPIIFAQAIMQVVMLIGGVNQTIGAYVSQSSFLYTMMYVALIIFFCYFYTAIQFNPKEMANNLQQSGQFIQGIPEGKRTAHYLEKIMSRIALSGGVFLALIAIAPQFISGALNVDRNVTDMLGGTGLLIVVGVALDVVQRVESYLLMRDSSGLGLSMGRSRGRR